MFPPIDNFIKEHKELYDYLIINQQVTMASNMDNHFKKIFLLSCASYYEQILQDAIKRLTVNRSGDERIVCFINKAISRQYHTYFDWESSNVNKFLSCFGADFKEKVNAEIKTNENLIKGMKAFLVLGNERNKMVHENFLIYNLDKTFKEIHELNENAISFLKFMIEKIVE